jgi:hypothetical protein
MSRVISSLHVRKITSSVGEAFRAIKANGDLEGRTLVRLFAEVIDAELDDSKKAGDNTEYFNHSSHGDGEKERRL